MSETCDCLLNITLPATLEEDLLDVLRANEQWTSGYSVLHADGFGAGARPLSTVEQVMGRSRRRLVQVLMQREFVEPLVAAIGGRFSTKDMLWWLTPVSACGRFE